MGNAITATESKKRTKTAETETDKELARLRAEFASKQAQVKAKGAITELTNAVKAGKVGDDLYPFAKQFCNFVERQRASAKKAQQPSA